LRWGSTGHDDAPIDLTAARLQPVPEVVERLEEMLERARSGEVRGFAMACEAAGAATGTVFVIGDADIARLVCAGRRLELLLLAVGE